MERDAGRSCFYNGGQDDYLLSRFERNLEIVGSRYQLIIDEDVHVFAYLALLIA